MVGQYGPLCAGSSGAAGARAHVFQEFPCRGISGACRIRFPHLGFLLAQAHPGNPPVGVSWAHVSCYHTPAWCMFLQMGELNCVFFPHRLRLLKAQKQQSMILWDNGQHLCHPMKWISYSGTHLNTVVPTPRTMFVS